MAVQWLDASFETGASEQSDTQFQDSQEFSHFPSVMSKQRRKKLRESFMRVKLRRHYHPQLVVLCTIFRYMCSKLRRTFARNGLKLTYPSNSLLLDVYGARDGAAG